MSVVSERFSQKVHGDEILILKQIIQKLLDHDSNARSDIPALFADLDQGNKIDISQLEDTYVQGKLYKLFKILRLRKSADNELEFRKKLEKDIHGFSFKRFIEFVIKELDEDRSESSNSQVSSSEKDAESDGEDVSS